MKKTTSRARPGKARPSGGASAVDKYIAATPEPARAALEKLRATIRSVVPSEATETISYRIPAFKYQGMLVWFAAFSNHCSLFPGASVIAAHKDDLKNYSTSKGTVHFPLNKPMPVALVKKLVKARVAEKRAPRKS